MKYNNRVTLGFSKKDEKQMKALAYLKTMNRKKARYISDLIVKALDESGENPQNLISDEKMPDKKNKSENKFEKKNNKKDKKSQKNEFKNESNIIIQEEGNASKKNDTGNPSQKENKVVSTDEKKPSVDPETILQGLKMFSKPKEENAVSEDDY